MLLGFTAGSPNAFGRSYYCGPLRHAAASATSVRFGCGGFGLHSIEPLARWRKRYRMCNRLNPAPGIGVDTVRRCDTQHVGVSLAP